jgi:hypothetical protein
VLCCDRQEDAIRKVVLALDPTRRQGILRFVTDPTFLAEIAYTEKKKYESIIEAILVVRECSVDRVAGHPLLTCSPPSVCAGCGAGPSGRRRLGAGRRDQANAPQGPQRHTIAAAAVRRRLTV